MELFEGTYSASPQSQLNVFQVQNWNPTLCNQAFLCYIKIEEIQRVIDSFDFSNFNKPILDIFRCSY